VQIVFRVVDDLTTVLLQHSFRVGTSVRHLAVNTFVAETLVSEDFEESGTSRAGHTKHKTHFSGLDHTGEVINDGLDWWLTSSLAGSFGDDLTCGRV